MREILFRGQLTSTGAWMYGSFYYEGLKIISISGTRYSVRPETVGEYVGIKDKTGTKIFTGDIYCDSENTFEVRFGDYEFEGADYFGIYAYSKELQTSAPLCRYDEPVIEVIGNIYQTPSINQPV